MLSLISDRDITNGLIPARDLRDLIPSRDSILGRLDDRLEQFYDKFFNIDKNKNISGNIPKLNVFEEDNRFYILAACPGVNSENIKAEVIPGDDVKYLKISMNSSDIKTQHKDAKYYMRELSSATFERIIQLPDNLSTDEPVQAELKDGILKLSWEFINKKQENKPSKPIKINKLS